MHYFAAVVRCSPHLCQPPNISIPVLLNKWKGKGCISHRISELILFYSLTKTVLKKECFFFVFFLIFSVLHVPSECSTRQGCKVLTELASDPPVKRHTCLRLAIFLLHWFALNCQRRMSASMNSNFSKDLVQQEIVTHNLQIKALIQVCILSKRLWMALNALFVIIKCRFIFKWLLLFKNLTPNKALFHPDVMNIWAGKHHLHCLSVVYTISGY